jgi:hypothetical protein
MVLYWAAEMEHLWAERMVVDSARCSVVYLVQSLVAL